MIYKNYNELISAVQKRSKKASFAIVCAEEQHTIAACLSAWKKGYFIPKFIGDIKAIETLILNEGYAPSDFELYASSGKKMQFLWQSIWYTKEMCPEL